MSLAQKSFNEFSTFCSEIFLILIKWMRIFFELAGCIGTFWKWCSLHNSDFSKHLHSYVTSYCCQTWTVDKDRRTNFARILQPVSTWKRTSKSLTFWNMNFISRWSSNTVWPINSFVRHGKDLYKSEGAHNCAEPGNATQSRFYVS